MSNNYEFEIKNETDYELVFEMDIKNSSLMWIFKTTARKNKVKIPQDISTPEVIEINPKFYNLIHTFCLSSIKKVGKEVGFDGYILVDSRVIDAKFTKKNKDWICKIVISGRYSK